MPLSTENSGGLTGKPSANGKVTVRFLIGTFVESAGRDVQAEEVLEISRADASFLLPYGYATTQIEEVTEDATEESTEDSADETDTTTDDTTEAAKVKVESKRRR